VHNNEKGQHEHRRKTSSRKHSTSNVTTCSRSENIKTTQLKMRIKPSMPPKNERKQTNKVMRSEKQHATKNPNAIIIKNRHKL
jgi:hypothetical protein